MASFDEEEDYIEREDEKSSLLGSRSAANGHDNEINEYDPDSAPTGCGATLICDPRRWLHRYFVLIFMCFLSFGSYFCYDNPGALTDTIKNDIEINTAQYVLFYSLYSWPNVILCFFGGFLLDRVFGVGWGTIIFSSIVTVGQFVFALGALVKEYWLMNVGRFIFGLGGESLSVAQNTYAVNWFEGRALNMVFGLQLSFSRVGSTVNMVTMQPLYDALNHHLKGHVCLGVTLFIGGAFCVFSLLCAFIMYFFDKRANRVLKKHDASAAAVEVMQLRDIKDFSLTVWILCGICVAYYVAIFPFIGLGLVFFENKYEMSHDTASLVNSLVYIISACASPFFGFCLDRSGKNIYWVLLGVLLTLGSHATLAFTFITPYVPVIVMGLSYSIVASALWPMVAMIVAKHQIGTAYGIMQSVQNLGLAIVSMVTGYIVDAKGYLILEVFFLLWLCLAFILVVVLYLVDSARGGKLNESAASRKRKQNAALGSDTRNVE